MAQYLWSIAVHLSCLLASIFGAPRYMSLSAWQYDLEMEGRWNIHRAIDALFLAAIGEDRHCERAWVTWCWIAAAIRVEEEKLSQGAPQ